MYWRYVSKNGEWVAINDVNSSYALKWFFVPRSAVPGICPGGAHGSGVWDT